MFRIYGAVCIFILSTSIVFATDYDEAMDGDLSDDPSMPTAFPLTPGDNTLSATSEGGDLEYFLATVPAGHQLSAIVLDDYSNSFGVSFIAVQPGSVFTEPPTGTDPGNLLGYYLFGAEDLGMDILGDMGMAMDAQGFTPPLPEGEFTYWSQETGNTVSYTYRFQVTPVPEPSGMALLAVGLWLGARRRSGLPSRRRTER